MPDMQRHISCYKVCSILLRQFHAKVFHCYFIVGSVYISKLIPGYTCGEYRMIFLELLSLPPPLCGILRLAQYSSTQNDLIT